MFKKILKVLLCVLLLTLTSCKKNDKVTLIEYEHYNPDKFYEDIDKLLQYSKQGDSKKAIKLYDELYKEYLKIYDLTSICELEINIDYTSEYYAEEFKYMKEIGILCEDALCGAMNEVVNGPCKDKFKNHLSVEMFRDFSEYEKLSDRLIDLKNQEHALVVEYDSLEYDDDFFEKASEIYVQLVKIRKEIAKEYGYDNYCDYADVESFDRDYNTDELNNFHEAVKILHNYTIDLDIDSIDYLDIKYDSGEENQIENLKTMFYGKSDLIDEAYDYFVDNKLYYMDDKDTNFNGAFTMSFYANETVYIYEYLNNDPSDITNLCHEFGHFVNMYHVPNPNPIFTDGCYDLFEIHSTTLELLSGHFLTEVMDDEYDAYQYRNIFANMSFAIINGCAVDEWERVIYTSDDMSTEEMCDLFVKIFKQYNCEEYDDETIKRYWTIIPHIFESPLYYISYATSAFAALQLWQISLDDFDKAIKMWEDIVKKGAFYTGYMEVIEEVGLIPFSESEKVKEILSEIVEYCEYTIFE